jgi:hypothetical protein
MYTCRQILISRADYGFKQKELFMAKNKLAIYLYDKELEMLRSLLIEELKQGNKISYSSLIAKIIAFYNENKKA